MAEKGDWGEDEREEDEFEGPGGELVAARRSTKSLRSKAAALPDPDDAEAAKYGSWTGFPTSISVEMG